MSVQDVLFLLTPYRFSWLAVMVFIAAGGCYWRGWMTQKKQGLVLSRWRALSFWLGLGLCYGVLHTRFDYYSQYMFFIHRGQHLVLHHIGPFLIALAAPWATLAAGFPSGKVKKLLAQFLCSAPVRWGYKFLQHPFIAPILFTGLIYFWLWPGIHFDAMLSQRLYLLMNWSMLLEGLLFWWLILDPRDPTASGTPRFGTRIVILWVATVPQLALGAYITFADHTLYKIYAICGRAWPIDPATDQILGGILTWIPPGMMGMLGMLIVLRHLLKSSARSK